MHFIILACLATVATARPSFIAVPADQIAFVDLSRLHIRVPRQTLSPPPPPPQLPQALYDEDYQPVPLQQYQQQPLALAPAPEHQQPLQRVSNFQQQDPQRVSNFQQQDPQRVANFQQQGPQDVAGAATLGASQRLAERPPDFGEYVDFGAHTGDHGAFGWYADYPVNQYEDHSRY